MNSSKLVNPNLHQSQLVRISYPNDVFAIGVAAPAGDSKAAPEKAAEKKKDEKPKEEEV